VEQLVGYSVMTGVDIGLNLPQMFHFASHPKWRMARR